MTNLVRNLVTGGAGFLGSHLVDSLMQSGEEVICLDNYFTGRKKNVTHWTSNPRFELIRHDVTEPIQLGLIGFGTWLVLLLLRAINTTL